MMIEDPFWKSFPSYFRQTNKLKMWSTLTLLLALLHHVTALDLDFCVGRENGLYPVPGQCQKYYSCSNGIAHEFSCPGGYL